MDSMNAAAVANAAHAPAIGPRGDISTAIATAAGDPEQAAVLQPKANDATEGDSEALEALLELTAEVFFRVSRHRIRIADLIVQQAHENGTVDVLAGCLDELSTSNVDVPIGHSLVQALTQGASALASAGLVAAAPAGRLAQ